MTPTYYPNISEDQILLINRVLRLMPDTPNFLNDPKCPYTPAIKEFLLKSVAPAPAAASTDLFEGDEVLSVEKQIQKLINDLEEYGKVLGSGDQAEKLQYLKTKAGLVEKLIGFQERINNLKQINEFRGIVIQFMDEVLDKDQITIFMQRIDGVLKNGN